MGIIKRVVVKTLEYCRFLRSEPNYREKLRRIKACKKKILLLGTPIHGNIGDHLIAEAEMEYLKQEFSEYEYIECTMPFSKYFFDRIRESITENDLVFVSGGGWLGSEWVWNEEFVRKIILQMNRCSLIILPQTVYYKSYDTFAASGKSIYTKNKKLVICVREQNSYDFFVNQYSFEDRNILLMPDFALFYRNEIKHKRNDKVKIGVCFRDDIEVSMNQAFRKNVVDIIKKYDSDPCIISTNTNGILIKPIDRSKVVKEKIKEISCCSILVTDRLHAMIMAAISGTPCIAFDNATHKVAGVYKWIENLEYVVLSKPEDDIEAVIKRLLLKQEYTVFDRKNNTEYLNKLRMMIDEMEETT